MVAIAGQQRGESKYDAFYKRNKSFRDFVANLVKTDPKWKNFNWEQTYGSAGSKKWALWKRFLRSKDIKTKAGYNTTSTQLASKLGVSPKVLQRSAADLKVDSTARIIEKLFPSISSVRDGRKVNLYKDPTPATIKEFKEFFKKGRLTTDTIKRVKEIDNLFRDMVVNGKKGKHLPDLFEVMAQTSANTPSKAAGAMAVYSRALRGEKFKSPIDIRKNNSAGERLITELGSNARNNAYRTAFYRLALGNINKQFTKSGTLGDFKKAFSTELRSAMKLTGKKKIPYNINEIISISAAESRGLRPFSVFVDATLADVNSKALASYQGTFSEKVMEVEKLIKQNKMAEASKAAATLKGTQATLGKTLEGHGYTKAQIKQLNFPEIVVGTKIDPKHYTPEKLAKLKKAGVDIPQFVKDRKFYIDIKKSRL